MNAGEDFFTLHAIHLMPKSFTSIQDDALLNLLYYSFFIAVNNSLATHQRSLSQGGGC